MHSVRLRKHQRPLMRRPRRVMGVLNLEFMSSEDSASEDEAPNESGSESDDETPRRKEMKKI